MLEKLLLLTLCLIIVELVASAFWIRTLWTFGVPIFRSTRKVIMSAPGLPQLADIRTAFPAGIGPQLVFRQFDETTLAFRESWLPRFLAFNYTPLMRGTVRFNRMNNSIEVTGYSYWWAFAMPALFAGILFESRSPELTHESGIEAAMLGFVGLVFGLLYLVQAIRFRGVAREIAEIMDAEVAFRQVVAKS